FENSCEPVSVKAVKGARIEGWSPCRSYSRGVCVPVGLSRRGSRAGVSVIRIQSGGRRGRALPEFPVYAPYTGGRRGFADGRGAARRDGGPYGRSRYLSLSATPFQSSAPSSGLMDRLMGLKLGDSSAFRGM